MDEKGVRIVLVAWPILIGPSEGNDEHHEARSAGVERRDDPVDSHRDETRIDVVCTLGRSKPSFQIGNKGCYWPKPWIENVPYPDVVEEHAEIEQRLWVTKS